MRHWLVLICHLILAISGISQAPAQDRDAVPVTGIRVLTLDAVRSGKTAWLAAPWKYHPGDNPEWASPTFDDTAWESISTWLFPAELPKARWEGIGWFRLHLSVPDKQLWNTPLALHVMYQAGASEIYLDGKLIYTFGKVGTRKEEEKVYWEREPQVISFSGKTDHLIAVRYSNFSAHRLIPGLGFGMSVAPLNRSVEDRVNLVRKGTTFQMVWTAISVFLMLQHLLLFIFYPRARENLFFAISTGSIGAFVFLALQFILMATSTTQILYLLRLLVCVFVLMFLSAMLFLYTLFYPKLLKRFWFFLGGWVVIFCLSMLSLDFHPGSSTLDISSETRRADWFHFSLGGSISLLLLFAGITLLEIARVIIVAVFKKKDGAWIFGLCSLAPFVLPFMLGFLVSQTQYEEIGWQFGVLAIILAPLFSMSVYLARNFSRTKRQLETEVLERRLLEAENTRKTEELEEAHKLQMAMLPQTVPELPNLDVAFEMHPATEVGGDYYDFNLTEDGRLTIAIGDATGHGTNAGLLVSAVKSLFKTSAPEAENLETLERISQGIKSMNLKRLYMAMTLVTFKNNLLMIAAAGMPPALIYRAHENRVEEIFLEGMPLGGFITSERQETSLELQCGDTVLLMSDGLPEMLNPANEMLDYPKTKALFAEVANQSPQAIIDHIFKASISWADGKPQADDVTLVVIKVKPNAC